VTPPHAHRQPAAETQAALVPCPKSPGHPQGRTQTAAPRFLGRDPQHPHHRAGGDVVKRRARATLRTPKKLSFHQHSVQRASLAEPTWYGRAPPRHVGKRGGGQTTRANPSLVLTLKAARGLVSRSRIGSVGRARCPDPAAASVSTKHMGPSARTSLTEGNGTSVASLSSAFQRLGPVRFTTEAQRTLMPALPHTPKGRRPSLFLAFLPSPTAQRWVGSSSPERSPRGATAPRDPSAGLRPAAPLRCCALEHGSFLRGCTTARQQTASLGIDGLWPQKASRRLDKPLQSTCLRVPASLPACAARSLPRAPCHARTAARLPSQGPGNNPPRLDSKRSKLPRTPVTQVPYPPGHLQANSPFRAAAIFRYLNETERLFPKRVSLGYINTERNAKAVFPGPCTATHNSGDEDSLPLIICLSLVLDSLDVQMGFQLLWADRQQASGAS